jgi:hypothetical protein
VPHRASRPALLLAAALLCGCASLPYDYGRDLETGLTLHLRPGEPRTERGRPHALLDGVGHYVISLPSKILLLSWKMNNHDISEETEAALQAYLDANGLCNVKVRLNQYAPGGEWRRLAKNREMPGAWRFTLGALAVSFYTILPDRFFAGLIGGDNYNPYTNTISLYSDSRAVALHEGGHAKDFAEVRNRHWKGLYAAIRILPVVPLWQEGVATRDALGWERAHGDARDERHAYRMLYPAYGTYVGGEASRFLPLGWISLAVRYGPVVVGHVVGQTRALFVSERPAVRGAAPAANDSLAMAPANDSGPMAAGADDSGAMDAAPRLEAGPAGPPSQCAPPQPVPL